MSDTATDTAAEAEARTAARTAAGTVSARTGIGDEPRHPADYAVLTCDLHRSFGTKVAVDGVDLAVPRGEIYGFLGPNGAGKSTTVRVLCTLLRPTSGTAHVAGYDVAHQALEVRVRIGVALQDAALDEKQTGRELLALQGRLYGLRPKEITQRLTQVLELVDIGDAIDRRIGTYSGGMKRRLDLAAALVHNPEVLFLDEPTTGLDPASRAHVWHEIRRLNTELGMTIFLTTQYLEEADVLCQRVGIISDGRIVAEGTPAALERSLGADLIVAELADPPGDPAALDGLRRLESVDSVSLDDRHLVVATSDGPGALSPVAVALNAAGLSVRALTLRTPTLDDVFMALTGTHIEGSSSDTVGEAP
jgi:ABC-2 type transport system ATP-binding protein